MRVVRRLLSPLLFLGALAAPAGALTLAQIPSPRPDGWVTDLTGTLSLQTVAELNRMGDQVQAETGAGMAVVVVSSTEGEPSRDLAARLFHDWRLDEKETGEKGKGLLLFVSVNEGTSEIVLGEGLDAARAREDAALVKGEIASRFRGGDAAGAIRQGAAACARRLLGANVTLASAPQVDVVEAPPPAAPPASVSGDGLLRVGLLVGLLLTFSAILLLLLKPRCPRCHQAMTKLDKAVNDPRLARSETVERLILNEGHDVWVCSACGEMQEIRRRLLFQCSVRTLEPARLKEATGSW